MYGNMTLGNLIDWLEAQDQTKRIKQLLDEREALTVYISALEKAGDGMRKKLPFNYKVCVAWDAARKAKP